MSLRSLLHVACFVLASVSVSAQQIVLSSSNVIGGSTTYSSGTDYFTGQFSALKVVDEQTGPISVENFQTYWIKSSSGGYFVLDLGAQYSISQIALFNTHNDGFNDFGTNAFTVRGSNSVSFLDANLGYTLSGASVILSSNLAHQPGQIPSAQSFTTSNGLASDASYRYLSFTTDSTYGGGGLNEIKVYGTVAAVPEPSTTAALAGFAVLGVALWHRRRRA